METASLQERGGYGTLNIHVETRPSGAGDAFRFGDFELHLDAYELRRAGAPVRLERQPMDLLILLVQQRGRLVTRAEIVDRIWGKDVFVDVETGVNTAVRKIRHALQDASDAPRFVETVPAKGYRFIAPVEPLNAGPSIQPTAPIAGGATATARLERRPRQLITSAIAVAVTALLVVAAWHYNRPEVASRTLAVLPFENISGDGERDYLADGLRRKPSRLLGKSTPNTSP